MSTPLRMSVALTVCLAVPAAIGFLWDKSPGNDAPAVVVELENRWLQAQDDSDALEPILAEDFVHVLPMGFIGKDEQLRYMRQHPGSDSAAKHFENLRVRVYGNAAVANGIVVTRSRDGKMHRTIFTDVFGYRDGKWQAVNAQENPLADFPGQ